MSTRTVFAIAAIIIVLIAVVVLYWPKPAGLLQLSDTSDSAAEVAEITTLKFGKTSISAEIVRSTSDLKRGLGGRESLNSKEGLLLAFEKDNEWGIWMKDMKFALDILWLDSNFEVVHVEEFIAPDTYPRIFTPQAPSRYVLEVRAGSISEFGVLEGDRLK